MRIVLGLDEGKGKGEEEEGKEERVTHFDSGF